MLTLNFDDLTTSATLKERAEGHGDFKELRLSGCHGNNSENRDIIDLILHSGVVQQDHVTPLDLLSFDNVTVSVSSLKSLLKMYPEIQSISFEDCMDLDVSGSLKVVGSTLQCLKSIRYVFKMRQVPPTDDVLSLLVKNCMSELTTLNFVGFDSAVDVSMAYVAECYFKSLVRVNFDFCPNLTNLALRSLAAICKNLKEVSFAGTKIDNPSVGLLAGKCADLERVDFTECTLLTDGATSVLTRRCPKLKSASFSKCPQITSESLDYIASSCPLIEHIDLSFTDITYVPEEVTSLNRLTSLNLDSCPSLTLKTSPPTGSTTTSPLTSRCGLADVLSSYKEACMSKRLKVVVLGDSKTGKTSLVNKLTSCVPCLDLTSLGVQTTLWQPFLGHSGISEQDSGLNHVVLDVWDLSGRALCHGVNDVCLSSSAVYVIVFNASSAYSCERIMDHVHLIQTKLPNSMIFPVGTHGDRLKDESKLNGRTEQVTQSMALVERYWSNDIKKELNTLKSYKVNSFFTKRIEYLNSLIDKRPNLQKCSIVSTSSDESINEFRKYFLRIVSEKMPLNRPTNSLAVLNLYKESRTAKSDGKLIISANEMYDMALQHYPSEQHLHKDLQYLHDIGFIMDLRLCGLGDEDLAYCMNPSEFCNLIFVTHMDTNFKEFRFDMAKFWTRDSGIRPPATSLISIIEQVTSKGILNEIVLPLVWQNMVNMSEDQLFKFIRTLIKGGFLLPSRQFKLEEYVISADKSLMEGRTGSMFNTQEIQIPSYPHLRDRIQYYLPLKDALQDTRPLLNWSTQPPKGDLQLGWRICFPNAPPAGILQKLASITQTCLPSQEVIYEYVWKTGILQKTKYATTYISFVYERNHIELWSRCNAEDKPVNQAMEIIWLHLSNLIICVQRYLSFYPGLYTSVSLIPMGLALYHNDVIINEKTWPLTQILDSIQNGKTMKFVDGRLTRQLNPGTLFPFPVSRYTDVIEWMEAIKSKQTVIFSLIDLELEDPGNSSPISSPTSSTSLLNSTNTAQHSSETADHRSNSHIGPTVSGDCPPTPDSTIKSSSTRRSTTPNTTSTPTPDTSSTPITDNSTLVPTPPTDTSSKKNRRRSRGQFKRKKVHWADTDPESISPQMEMKNECESVTTSVDRISSVLYQVEQKLKNGESLFDDTIFQHPVAEDKVREIARKFVGSLLTSSIAECVVLDVSEGPCSEELIKMQVNVANLTATAIEDARHDRMEQAAMGILNISRGVQDALHKQRVELGHHSRSITCTLL